MSLYPARSWLASARESRTSAPLERASGYSLRRLTQPTRQRLCRFATARVDAVLAEVEKIDAFDFPYPQGRIALERVEQALVDARANIRRASESDDDGLISNACRTALFEVEQKVPLVGFLLRSTNVRNAFELCGPLDDLAKRVAGDHVTLLLSSEWRGSPFTYEELPGLRDIVLVGLPAPESSNALLTPLAGHEIGHAVWQEVRDGPLVAAVETAARAAIEDAGGTIAVSGDIEDAIALIYQFAEARCRETFCDCVGVALFGTAFFDAFAYLLGPGNDGQESLDYPAAAERLSNMLAFADKIGVPPKRTYLDAFDQDPSGDDGLELGPVPRLAAEAFAEVTDEVLDVAAKFAATKGLPDIADGQVDVVLRAFKNLIPCAEPPSLAALVNAGWSAYYDEALWRAHPGVQGRRDEVLNELMLKSAEILEIKKRTQGVPGA